jgi:predicted KAP-like P-loop ATPase
LIAVAPTVGQPVLLVFAHFHLAIQTNKAQQAIEQIENSIDRIAVMLGNFG